MKRRITEFIIMMLVMALPIHASFQEVDTKGFELQGGYESFFSITVNPIEASSAGFLAGMPFDLESDMILPSTSEGLQIAKWTMLSNQPDFTIEVVCDPLWNEDHTHKVDYVLIIEYPLSYYINANSQNEGGRAKFTVSSNANESGGEIRNPIKGNTDIDQDSFVGTTDGTISLKLARNTLLEDGQVDTLQQIKDIPAGFYTGNVTIRLKMVE